MPTGKFARRRLHYWAVADAFLSVPLLTEVILCLTRRWEPLAKPASDSLPGSRTAIKALPDDVQAGLSLFYLMLRGRSYIAKLDQCMGGNEMSNDEGRMRSSDSTFVTRHPSLDIRHSTTLPHTQTPILPYRYRNGKAGSTSRTDVLLNNFIQPVTDAARRG